ncbi:hypothetical protein [Gellertiella hungarica]|uniref:Uncharacterized protein n=1 Tax=Gellertiella hungarica TaxID=1572859 RepID=A0A7W6J6M2_9HYPH|nr:hypothetical protein [Gellertiella hungarica]MBB4065771.1 hypothetical protein [Gellertiella hungarica]
MADSLSAISLIFLDHPLSRFRPAAGNGVGGLPAAARQAAVTLHPAVVPGPLRVPGVAMIFLGRNRIGRSVMMRGRRRVAPAAPERASRPFSGRYCRTTMRA